MEWLPLVWMRGCVIGDGGLIVMLKGKCIQKNWA